MKVGTIIYHKDIESIYKKEWIDECVDSVINQTYKDFTVYELNYGDGDINLFNSSKYYKKKFDNHADAMNFLLEECVLDGCDVVFNNNMDDFSDLKRFEIQLEKMKEGYDIVSSNFTYIDSNGCDIRKMNMIKYTNIKDQFKNENNIIAHPSVCYSRKFLLENKYNGDEIPEEDFLLWKRTFQKYNFFICPEFLLNYRIHDAQITKHHEDKNKSDILEKSEEDILLEFLQRGRKSVIKTCVYCDDPIDEVKYNFCQKCNELYQ